MYVSVYTYIYAYRHAFDSTCQIFVNMYAYKYYLIALVKYLIPICQLLSKGCYLFMKKEVQQKVQQC